MVLAEIKNKRIILDMKYATEDNFIGKKLYPSSRAFALPHVVDNLNAAQEELNSLGLRLKIWDAYRPQSIQRLFWSHMPDERYVARPEKGSFHNRGAAVDVTLCTETGIELFMPTRFDDFTPQAHLSYTNLSSEQIENRFLLQSIMTAHGFVPFETEWWHFNVVDAHEYPLLDISFESLHFLYYE